MAKLLSAELGDKRKHSNVDWRTREKVREEGVENSELFGNTDIETGDVVSEYWAKVKRDREEVSV